MVVLRAAPRFAAKVSDDAAEVSFKLSLDVDGWNAGCIEIVVTKG